MPIRTFERTTDFNMDHKGVSSENLALGTQSSSNATTPAARTPFRESAVSSAKQKDNHPDKHAQSSPYADPLAERRTKTSMVIERSSRLVVDEEIEGSSFDQLDSARLLPGTETKTTTVTTTTVNAAPGARPAEGNLSSLERWRMQRAGGAANEREGKSPRQGRTTQSTVYVRSTEGGQPIIRIESGENKPYSARLNPERASRGVRGSGSVPAKTEASTSFLQTSASQNGLTVQSDSPDPSARSRVATASGAVPPRRSRGLDTVSSPTGAPNNSRAEKESTQTKLHGNKPVSVSVDIGKDTSSAPAVHVGVPPGNRSSAKASNWRTNNSAALPEASPLGRLKPDDAQRGSEGAGSRSSVPSVTINCTHETSLPPRKSEHVTEQQVQKGADEVSALEDEREFPNNRRSTHPRHSVEENRANPERKEGYDTSYRSALPSGNRSALQNVASKGFDDVLHDNIPATGNAFVRTTENRRVPQPMFSYGEPPISPQKVTPRGSAETPPRDALTDSDELQDFIEAYCNSNPISPMGSRAVSREITSNPQGVSPHVVQQQQYSTPRSSASDRYQRRDVIPKRGSLEDEMSKLWENLEMYQNHLERSTYLVYPKDSPKKK